ncbi:flavodoxin family protein [Rhodanobacter umsongensis]|uniref:Flavodoxin family protein n=1 Tax=Rhodanobacter umsongensis TaxID=633153 RepID=A0ABW0JP40_9GAMM
MKPASPTLVAYYSRTGKTARVGHALASRLGADELVIEETRGRGRISVWRAMLDRMLGTLPPIGPVTVALEDYASVLLGTPVWAGGAASPIRRFLRDYGARLRQVSFFCTMDGSGAQNTFADMQKRLGKAPQATFAFDAKAMDSEHYPGTLDALVATAQRSTQDPAGMVQS